MKPGYSRLLIHDAVLAESGISRLMAAQDLNMLAILHGTERTAASHMEYLTAAGLKIDKIYDAGDGISESIIEADVA